MPPALLHRCDRCWTYTLKDLCPRCGGPARSPHPARWSPEDRYQRYRRALLEAPPPAPPAGGAAPR